ncbi:MAG: hypothetical protein HY700_20000 [Gemmatimonadetes bacterium]|nr:hypothetical protein [Gemmatimonadota bacterium]
MPLRLLTLGAVRCYRDGAELTELPAQRLRCAVLLYLAMEREATREILISLLWPERDSERGRHALNQKLYELRQVLGDDWLESQGDRMRMNPAFAVDAHQFESAAQQGALEEALSLYDGEFLAGFYLRESTGFEHWADRHRARLARRHRTARGDFINQCVARGDVPRAIAEARRWVELEPVEDEAQHRLIELLASTGNRAEAIRQYESYERALKADDLVPLDHTRALIDQVRQSSAPPGPPAPQSADSERPRSPGPITPDTSLRRAVLRRGRVTTLALTTIVLLAGAGWWASRRYARGSATPARSVAVLPFLNFSSNPGASEHLSDGIAEDLINALAQTDSLYVVARTSSFRFRNKDLDIHTIGDSLHVALLVEGSIRQEGNRLRVTAQLINVADGYHLWSHTFDRELEDVLAVEQEIANAMVDALRIKLRGPERARLAVGGTTDPRAYDLFLRGRYLLQKATRAAVLHSIAYLDSAVAREPRYALAQADLAEAHVLAAATGDLPYDEALDTAKAAAEQAIREAPELSEAHAALGRVALERWEWAAAEREAILAIRLNPKNASAHTIYTGVLMVRGRTDEAVREAALAAQLEPLSAAAADNHAEALRAARRFAEAVRIHRKALELEPSLGRQNLAKAYIELGQYDSALAQFRGAVAAGAPHLARIDQLWAAYTYARAGDRAAATAWLQQFKQGGEPRRPNYLLAATYLALGEKDRVFPLLQSGIAERSQRAWRQLPWDPIWDPIRRDPRFVRILEQMNLR